jgi:predicted alpha/beta-fold hydrolase
VERKWIAAVDGVGITSAPQSSASDETPMVVIIPGLTSDSDDAYVKHIAYSSVMKGWRTLVANHRGLGGVSITVSAKICYFRSDKLWSMLKLTTSPAVE